MVSFVTWRHTFNLECFGDFEEMIRIPLFDDGLDSRFWSKSRMAVNMTGSESSSVFVLTRNTMNL